MATVTQQITNKASLTVTGLSTLASATYVASNAVTPNTNKNIDSLVEVTVATTNTPSGNKQVVVFLIESLDGTVFRSGPTSGTTTTDEPDLKVLGVIPMNTNSTNHIAMFSIAQSIGYVPYAYKVVFKNDLGVALTSATVNTYEIVGTVV